ncbi:DUF4153 domain-containing protein [Polaribacter porphyrae]|uniref:Uncharacterized protein n=1 Tax=Polaribacter porphyrae TaxID=1137780 RepID=A0A2S7WNS5_9FLAO|nr:DUF4173 domain-containing protein [Polaribacter porphyrae]PQJ79250.1 hypothetical protein BTO18_08725 [Polaribacter porphyrae]
MKNLILLTSAILFSTLFYRQGIGLNLSLFTLLTIIVLVINNKTIIKTKIYIIKIFAYFITGVVVFLYKSDLTIIANIIAFFTLIGSISELKSSIYIKFMNGIYTTIVAAFSLYFDKQTTEIQTVKKNKINYVYWLKIIGIPALFLIIFISLYRNGNPKFNELILKIDFSFINLQWILFTGLGYYLFYNITNPITIDPATSLDLNTGNYLNKNEIKHLSPKKIKEENKLGIVLLYLLNALIILFLITDVLYLSELYQMTAPELSKQVHTGVNALIFSNLLAIAIILYFFRGNLNFYDKNKGIKNASFLWIFLNLTVILITAIKNMEYINSFGFTYKRIGVLFFLMATSLGLMSTYFKVQKTKNLWYLFRKNTQIAFAVLILSSTLNWDKFITYYNINYAEQLDLKYLINLSDNNTFLLKGYAEKGNLNNNDKFDIDVRHNNYIRKLRDNSWQEMVFDNVKITE